MIQTDDCYMNKHFHSVDCEWNEWEAWSTCSKTCGTGFQVRPRSIKTHEANGGTECSGLSTEVQSCSPTECGNLNIISPRVYGRLKSLISLRFSLLFIYDPISDPCDGVSCASGLTGIKTLGMCQCLCATSLCDLSSSNTCANDDCKCGSATQCISTSTIPVCLSSDGATPTWGDSGATCQASFVTKLILHTIF